MKQFLTVLCIGALLFSATASAQEDFPGRKLFEDVAYMTVEQLGQQHASAHVVDVRSPYEYETIHIKDAINIPLSSHQFSNQVAALRSAGDRPIVFYCNGHTCMKSYKAARKSQVFGVSGVYAFDAGIFDWAKAHPERTVLLGKSPINPADLISGDEFKSRLLEPAEFENRVLSGKYYVIDARSRMQRAATGLFPFLEQRGSLDDEEQLNGHIKKAMADGKPLLIYDKVGKQVRWLEYRLQAMGVTDYHFLKGGADGFFDALPASGRFADASPDAK
jgi:rhodanese-related sulfurtransferase